jgi:two-component sensor histidine kinase
MLALYDRPVVAIDHEGAWLILEELNHRVGNEFMAVIAALNMMRRQLQDTPIAADFLDEAVLRLEGFCQVHKVLDRKRPHDSASQRLEMLCEAMSRSKAAANGIHIALSADDVTVDDETSWTLSVVAAELMTNAFKHAFCKGGRRVIGVNLREEDETVLLTVADNGVGAAPTWTQAILGNPGVGWSIVQELADRLGGTITRHSGLAGTTVTLRVPTERRAQ